MEYIYATDAVSTLNLGYQGEQGSRAVQFPKLTGYTGATAQAKRQGDAGYYEITLTDSGPYYEWAVGAYDVANPGWGKVQVTYTDGSARRKTKSWDTKTIRSIEGSNAPTDYTGGAAINVNSSNRTISLKFDDDQFTVNDANELTYIGSSADVTVRDFTLANTAVYESEHEGAYVAMTCGDSAEDTLVWTDGEIVWNLGDANTPRWGYGQISAYSIANYDKTDPHIDEWFDFMFNEDESTTYSKMKWKISKAGTDDVFTCVMVKSDGTAETVATHTITGYICHFEIITDASGITAESANGKLHDPIYPLPHDCRMDTAFDEQGYVVIGNKRIQLRDLSNLNVKDLDTTDICRYFDGESTYIYDFFRRSYALIEAGDLKDTSIELPLLNALTPGDTVKMGVYNMNGGWETELGSYTPTDEDNIYYMKFTAKYSSEQDAFKVNWALLDASHSEVYKSQNSYEYGPAGIYIQLEGDVGIFDFVDYWQLKNISARYTRWDNTTAEVEYQYADTRRDWTFFGDNTEQEHYVLFNASSCSTLEELGALPKNYYMTNGKFVFEPNRSQLPAGTWTFAWRGVDGEEYLTQTYNDTAELYVTRVQMLREAKYGMSVIIKFNDDSIQTYHQEGTINNSDWAMICIGFEPAQGVQIPDDFIVLYPYDYTGTYEKKFPINFADADNYGAVKIDNSTIKINTNGQIYVSSSAIDDLVRRVEQLEAQLNNH